MVLEITDQGVELVLFGDARKVTQLCHARVRVGMFMCFGMYNANTQVPTVACFHVQSGHATLQLVALDQLNFYVVGRGHVRSHKEKRAFLLKCDTVGRHVA
jgi:hypothetical protein